MSVTKVYTYIAGPVSIIYYLLPREVNQQNPIPILENTFESISSILEIAILNLSCMKNSVNIEIRNKTNYVFGWIQDIEH